MLFQSQGLGLLKNVGDAPSVPVISNVSITRSTITQVGTTTVKFKVTNITEDDSALVEIVGKGFAQQAATTDNENYTLVINGSDLSTFSMATVRIIAFNDLYVVTDESLRLTVTAPRSRSTGSSQRSPDIDPGHDELELLEAMLNDKFVNHGLDKILKDLQIIRVELPENYGEYPGCRIYGGQWIAARLAEEVDEDEEFIDLYQKSVLFELYVMINQEVKYGGKVYEGVRVLTLIRDILLRIFTEQLDYPTQASDAVKAKFTDIQIDHIDIDSENWAPEYLGQPDAVGLLIGILVAFEKKRL